MTNKKQQKPTKKDAIMEVSVLELTPVQEQAAYKLATGESITSVAESLNLNRSTIYQWQQSPIFKYVVNQFRKEAKDYMKGSLLGMMDEALMTLKGLLKSSNDQVKMKAALAVIDKVDAMPTFQLDLRSILKEECMEERVDPIDEVLGGEPQPYFNTAKYNKLLKQFNLPQV